MTHHIAYLLQKRGLHFSCSAEMEIVREIKEKFAYVAPELHPQANQLRDKKTYKLPDGSDIDLDEELFRGPEILFQQSSVAPQWIGGTSGMVHESISQCETDLHESFYENIVVSGGSTMLSGFRERLRSDMSNYNLSDSRVRVVAPPERKISVWIGGSILASLSCGLPWVTKDEYDENGPSIIHKCS